MINNTIKNRMVKNRPMTPVTLRMPVDVVESLKAIAPQKGFSGYQALLKAYIGEGLRKDEALFAFSPNARLIEVLKKHGVTDEVLQAATNELIAA